MKNNLLLISVFMLLSAAGFNTVFAQSEDANSNPNPEITKSPVPTPFVVQEVKVLPFKAEIIPDTYFSADLNTAKNSLYDSESDKASQLINKSIKNTTKRSPLQKAYILEGLLNFSRNKFKDAVESYDNYLKLHASNSDVLYLKAQALIKAGNNNDAMTSLHEAIWFNKFTFTSPAEVNLQISNIFLASGDKIKANEFLNKALSAKADSIPVLYQLAELELEEGKKAEAVARMRSALTADPQNEDCKLLLAKALLTKVNRTNELNAVAEARTISQEVLDKTTVPAHAEEAAALLIKSNIEDSKFEDASKLIDQYLKKYPKSTELLALNHQLKIEIEGAALEEAKKTPVQ